MVCFDLLPHEVAHTTGALALFDSKFLGGGIKKTPRCFHKEVAKGESTRKRFNKGMLEYVFACRYKLNHTKAGTE